MKREKKEATVKIKNQRSSDSGVAIIMVMTTIMLLLIILANFSFDTDLNKLKVYNSQDRAQAKLNAEAGISFALSKLRLYQEARNTLEKNQSLKDVIPEGQLQSMIIQPLIYPPPVPEQADIIQKTAINEFTQSSLIEGNIAVSIRPISGFINPNNLRFPTLPPIKLSGDQVEPTEQQQEEQNKKEEEAKNLQKSIEKELVKMIEDGIKQKIEADPANQTIYGEIDAKMRVKELKFFVNEADKFKDDEKGDLENLYSEAGVKPKHAPMTSLSEMYLLAGWSDQLINLIIDRLTVHESAVIAVNELTESQLKMLFPEIEEDQVNKFFIYRDGDPNAQGEEVTEDTKPHPFKNVKAFKSYIVTEAAITTESAYDERIAELKKAGLTLGVAGKLFIVSSRGEIRNAVYEIEAIVDLPIKEKEEPKSKAKSGKSTKTVNKDDDTSTTTTTKTETTDKSSTDGTDKKTTPVEYLSPRIVEITIR